MLASVLTIRNTIVIINDYLRSDLFLSRIVEKVATNFSQRVGSGQIFHPLDLKANLKSLTNACPWNVLPCCNSINM